VVAEAEEAEGEAYTCDDLAEGEGEVPFPMEEEEVPFPMEEEEVPFPMEEEEEEVLSPVENLEW
jgi:hypothetical protein